MKERMIVVPAGIVEAALRSARAVQNWALADELRKLLIADQSEDK